MKRNVVGAIVLGLILSSCGVEVGRCLCKCTHINTGYSEDFADGLYTADECSAPETKGVCGQVEGISTCSTQFVPEE